MRGVGFTVVRETPLFQTIKREIFFFFFRGLSILRIYYHCHFKVYTFLYVLKAR